MPTLQLTNNEHQMLLDLFSTIADLDLNETVEDSDNQTFDSLWDKIIHLEWSFLLEIYHAIIRQTLCIHHESFLTKG